MKQVINQSSLLSKVNEQMTVIPGGKIALRDDRTKQQWMAEIKPFLLGKFQVTQQLYFDVLQESPATIKGNQKPIETVSWKDAVIFCNTLSKAAGYNACYTFDDELAEVRFDIEAEGFRLPTEAEWEYACKAGTTGVRYAPLDSIAWYRENSGKTTHDVGLKEPNPWGLYDMLGNVWEWCSDLYDEEIYGSYRILRGGGWYDEARGCLATNRRRSHPLSFKIDDLGFRIAQTLK